MLKFILTPLIETALISKSFTSVVIVVSIPLLGRIVYVICLLEPTLATVAPSVFIFLHNSVSSVKLACKA